MCSTDFRNSGRRKEGRGGEGRRGGGGLNWFLGLCRTEKERGNVGLSDFGFCLGIYREESGGNFLSKMEGILVLFLMFPGTPSTCWMEIRQKGG